MRFSPQSLLQFFAEAGSLKALARSGWSRVGINSPESVADHTWRSMLIGYALAELEKEDPQKVVTMLLFHDLHETRLGDLHKMAQHYIDSRKAESAVVADQCTLIPSGMATAYAALQKEFEEGKTRVAVIARDAERLDCALQAIEYRPKACGNLDRWVNRIEGTLVTPSAKQLLSHAKSGAYTDWSAEISAPQRTSSHT